MVMMVGEGRLDEISDMFNSDIPRAAEVPETRKPQLFCVDDDTEQLNILGIYFRGRGYDVVEEVSTTVAAQRIGAGDRPDVVIADYDNSGASRDEQGGATLFHALRGAGFVGGFLVVSGSPRYALVGIERADGVLEKPYSLKVLEAKINEVYRRKAFLSENESK